MPLLSSRLTDLLQRQTSEQFYTDAAVYIAAPSLTVLDDYGQPTAAGSETTIRCAFTDKPSPEKWRDFVDIAELAGEIRFTSPVPTKGGRVRVTKRFGQSVTPQTFEIIGIQNRGAFGYVCALKAVTV